MKDEVKELAKLLKELVKEEVSKTEKVEDEKKGKIFGKDVKKMTEEERNTEFIKALLSNSREKLELLSEGTDADGGYLVPDEYADRIVEDLRDATVIRPRATVITTRSKTLNLPSLATRPKVYWRGELAAKSTSSVTFDNLQFTPYSLAVIIGLSQELADDASLGVGSGGIVGYVQRLIVQAIAEEEDKKFATGSGSGEPTGITQYTSSMATVDAGGALSGDHFIKLYHKIPQGYRKNGVWLMNSRTISEVRQLKDSNNRYLIQDLAGSPQPTLLGRPIIEQNDLPSSQVYYGDLQYYTIVQRQGISTRVSDEATVASSSAFEKNLVYVRVEERVDGKLVQPKAFGYINNTGVS